MARRAIRPTKRFSIRDTRPRAYRAGRGGDDLEPPPLEFLFTRPWGFVYRPPAVPPPHSPPRVARTDQAGYPISYATYRFRSRCVLAGHGHGHRPLPVLYCGAGSADSALSALSPPSLHSSLPASVSRLTPPRAAPPLFTLPSRRPRRPLIAAVLSSNPARSGCRLVHCKTMTLDTVALP
ncbi:hypothetical protein B0H14DRAFT_2944101 [Mycena olivaceomarginata]|nr:hypothetical protein B0H14DRAFT_2944101 [Mycena olivaceomarginata]